MIAALGCRPNARVRGKPGKPGKPVLDIGLDSMR